MEAGTKYSSDTNPHWLNGEELRRMVEEYKHSA
jgi:hypothetical protein